MDFLKTLMLYMSLTFATTMQAAPVPEATLEPTATPYVVEETATPAAETTLPAVTAQLSTSQITATPTVEPVPTITPNTAYKKLAFGDRGAEVTKLQQRLIELGYLAEGQADGAFGYQTRNAVIAFQKANGLSADGTPAAATLTQLYENPDVVENPDKPTPAHTTDAEPTMTPNTSYPVLRLGQKSDDVKQLQQRLIELGYLAEGQADGSFGYQTRNAVIAFQKANGLSADGTPGNATLTQLYENPNVIAKSDAEVATAEPEATIALPETTQEPADSTLLPGASVIYNESPLAYHLQQDGVTVERTPQVYQMEDGRIQLSLPEVTQCMEDWSLTQDGDLIAITASGYVVTLLRIGERYSCVVDGKSVALEADDVTVTDGVAYITADFLQKALGAQVSWEAEENALLVTLKAKTEAD